MILQKFEINALHFVIWEENLNYFWRCRSLEDGSFFESAPYRKWQRLLVDVHLYALKYRIAFQKFPGVVIDFESDRILAHNQVAARIFSLAPKIQEEKADASKYWKNRQIVDRHKKELILNGENIVSLDLLVPSGGISLGISSRDEIYKMPDNRLAIVTNVFELRPIAGSSV